MLELVRIGSYFGQTCSFVGIFAIVVVREVFAVSLVCRRSVFSGIPTRGSHIWLQVDSGNAREKLCETRIR